MYIAMMCMCIKTWVYRGGFGLTHSDLEFRSVFVGNICLKSG